MGQKIGDIAGGNYFEIESDGTPYLRGNAKVWHDMVGDLFGKRLNGTTGKVDYDWAENAIKFQAGGSISNIVDRVGANLEIDHDMLVGSGVIFRPHIHWFQDIVSGASAPFVLTMEYRLQRNGYAKTTAWTTTTLTVGTSENVFDFSSSADGTYNQITKFPEIVVECGLSDTFQFRMARTDSEAGNMLVYFMDLHGQRQGLGSAEEYVL